MTSTFAIQPIPPFKPKQQPAPPSLPPVLNNSHSSSTPPSASLPPNSASTDTWQPRRFSTTGVTGGTGHAYPSVFEIPNPQKSMNGGGTKGNDSTRGLSGVAEEDERRVNNVKKRRASDEIEGERSETGSRRGSGEVANDAHDERRGSNESIRSSFSIPANPHPRPPPLVTRTSAPTVTSPPFRNSPSPNSTRDRQFHNTNPERESPNSSSKRARTSMSTLESLAATATNLLSSSASSVSSSNSTPPTTASSSINHVLGPPSNAQTREHQTALETSRNMREQQQREIERRRIANGGTNQPTPGSVAAALGKLQGGGGSSYRHSERGGSVEGAEGTGTGTGLAKRRGHRPPAVSTGSFPPSSSSSSSSTNPLAINSSSRSSAYEEAMRSAPPGIPSVLVGSPVEASWAARVGKEANVGSARGNASTSNSNSTARRQSTSAMNAAYPSVREPLPSQPYPNPVVRTNGTSSRPGSYSHHHSASSQSMSTSHSKDRHPPPQQSSLTLNPPNSAPYVASHSHSHHPLSNTTRLPSLNQIVHSRPSPPSSSSQPPYHQHHHHHQHPPPPPLSPSPQSASKSAFLSLFSTFFDSLQDSRVLTNTLDQQISRAGSLLQTLQQSEECLERLVERKMAEAQVRWMEQVERKYEGRLERLENAVLTSSTKRIEGEERDGYVGLGIMDQIPTTTCFPASSSSTTTTTEDRLNKLERLLMVASSSDGHRGDGKAFEGGRENGNGEKSLPTPHEERENGVNTTSYSANGGVRGVVDGRDT